MGIIIIIVLACAVAVIDRKVEAAERQEELEEYIEAICEPRHICPELIEATIERESRWNPNAVNGDCMGLMQISERWHRERMKRLGVTDLFDPYDNILVGVDYMAELFEKYEDPGTVLMVYHGEKNAIEKASSGGISGYADWILTRSAELEREHGK
jgi:soluble lytic murein transglycosylase-like protein